MATQITRINPLDLQGNIAIGVSLPFNQPSVFSSTYSTKEQIKSNLINLVLTNKGERLYNPNFGTSLRNIIFEGITIETQERVRNTIIENVNFFMPEVNIVDVVVFSEEDNNTINITIKYNIKLSGTPDQITVEFI
jgi:phage baseplate assembly protein W